MKINDLTPDQIKFNQYGNELWNLAEEKIICPECGREYSLIEDSEGYELEKQTIEEWGYCLSCDHIKGEVLDEERALQKEQEYTDE